MNEWERQLRKHEKITDSSQFTAAFELAHMITSQGTPVTGPDFTPFILCRLRGGILKEKSGLGWQGKTKIN